MFLRRNLEPFCSRSRGCGDLDRKNRRVFREEVGKSQIPNSKSQKTPNGQIPKVKSRTDGTANGKYGFCLEEVRICQGTVQKFRTDVESGRGRPHSKTWRSAERARRYTARPGITTPNGARDPGVRLSSAALSCHARKRSFRLSDPPTSPPARRTNTLSVAWFLGREICLQSMLEHVTFAILVVVWDFAVWDLEFGISAAI
jgi:hypothetical protein